MHIHRHTYIHISCTQAAAYTIYIPVTAISLEEMIGVGSIGEDTAVSTVALRGVPIDRETAL